MNKLLSAISILVVVCAVLGDQSISEFCTPPNVDFVEKATKRTLKGWNAVNIFNTVGQFLGQGAFGVVKKAEYPLANGKVLVAIKQIQITEDNYMTLPLIIKELKVNELVAIKDPEIGPMFYGCQYTLDNEGYLTGIYMVNQMLYKTFEKDQAAIQAMGKLRFLYLNYEIIDKLDRLWKLGYRHSDIKPGNIMVNEQRTHAYLVDFGLAQQADGECVPSGTPGYLAPGAWIVRDECIQRDDIYSWMITFVASISPLGEQAVWNRSGDEAGCIDSQPDKFCMLKLRVGIINILERAGWGEWDMMAMNLRTYSLSNLAGSMLDLDRVSMEMYFDDIKDILVSQQLAIKAKLAPYNDSKYDAKVDLNDGRLVEERAIPTKDDRLVRV